MLTATTIRDGPHSGMHLANTPAKELTSQAHKETLTACRKKRGVLFMYIFPQCWGKDSGTSNESQSVALEPYSKPYNFLASKNTQMHVFLRWDASAHQDDKVSCDIPHASETSIEKEKEASERMWEKWNSNIRLAGMENVADPGRQMKSPLKANKHKSHGIQQSSKRYLSPCFK